MSEVSVYSFTCKVFDYNKSREILHCSEPNRYMLRSDHRMPFVSPEPELINISVNNDEIKDFKLHDFYRSSYQTFPIYLASIPNVTVYSPLMIGFIKNDLIIETIPPWRRNNLYFFKNLSTYINCESVLEINVPLCMLANYSHTNYWHWMTQCLVNINIIRAAGIYDDVKFLIPNSNQKYIQETLNILGIENNKIVYSGNEKIVAKHLIYPCFLEEHSNGRFSPLILDIFNNVYYNVLKKSSYPCTELVYFSRRDTNSRRILNEDFLIDALQKIGFRIVTCSEYTIQDQISIAARASVIVSAHGAALTNIGFSSRLTKIFEINPHKWGVSCFYSLTRMRHQQHFMYIEKNVFNIEEGHKMTMMVNVPDVIEHLSNFCFYKG